MSKKNPKQPRRNGQVEDTTQAQPNSSAEEKRDAVRQQLAIKLAELVVYAFRKSKENEPQR